MSEIKMPNRKGLSIVSKKSERLKNGLDGLKDLSLQSEEEWLKTKEKEQKRQEQKQAKKDKKLNQNTISNTTQTNENPPSQEKTKIKIISFLGLSRGENGAKARYNSDNFTLLDIKSGDYENATELLIDNYNDGLSDMQMKFFATQDAFNKQKDILQKCKIFDGDFDINHECFIKYNKTDYNELYKKLLDEIGNTSEKTHIIVDITHGFRDNTFLSILASLIQLNINKNRIIRFMVAKEIIQYEEYELISLDEYIENMVMSNVLSTFKQCLKVPDYNLDNSLYLALKGFSDALFKNQIQDIILNLQNLEKNILDTPKSSYIYPLIKDIKDTLYDLLNCKITKNKDNEIEPTKEIYYELSRLYHKHNYALNSSQFLLEAMYFYMFKEFEQVRQTQNIKYSYNELEKIKKFINDFASADTLALNYEDEKNKKKLTDGILYVNFVDSFPNDIQLLNDYVKFRINVSKLRNVMSHCDAYKQDKDNNYLEQISKLKKEYKKLNQKSLTNEFKSALNIYLNSSRKTHTGLMHLLFSHELSKEQEQDAKNNLKVSKFKKLPSDLQELFSNVPADDKSITQVVQIFQDYLKKEAKKGDYVLISGDFGLVYQLVSFCKNRDLKPVYATTKRDVLKDENGIKQSMFRHVRFRLY